MFNSIDEKQKKMRDVIEEIKTCMFTTTDEQCTVFSRPMFTVKIDNEYRLWFFVNEQSEKMQDITDGSQVTLVYAHPGKNTYMNVYGTCRLEHDKNKMKELWTPAFKSWFPEGIDQPSVCLLQVSIQEAHYWDNSSSDMICLYKADTSENYPVEEETEVLSPSGSNW